MLIRDFRVFVSGQCRQADQTGNSVDYHFLIGIVVTFLKNSVPIYFFEKSLKPQFLIFRSKLSHGSNWKLCYQFLIGIFVTVSKISAPIYFIERILIHNFIFFKFSGQSRQTDQTGNYVDYHFEASEYEKKLIQVAEMHGELLEFNEHLQKVLHSKDNRIRKLRLDLVDLRGPLPAEESGMIR